MDKSDIFIRQDEDINTALKRLDASGKKVLLVVDDSRRLLGTVTDGDIRRYILRGESLEGKVDKVYHQNPVFVREHEFSIEKVQEMMISTGLQLIPLVDDMDRVCNYVTWGDIFAEVSPFPSPPAKVDIPVVIMAGGKGVRLDPFTRILPKPLVPVGDKPVVERIIEEFKRQGVGKFYFMINYKGEMIEAYFNGTKKEYGIEYIKEPDFYGTAGSLSLLKNRIEETFIVSNCDVIVNADFHDVLAMHGEACAMMTVISSIQHHKVPYGVIKINEKGEIGEILEKPEYTFVINTGVYVMERDVLNYIPDNCRFDMTDLIKKLISSGEKVITYPVNENDYIDIGQWEEYKKSLEKIKV